jgi:hypothetical protein
MHEYRPGEAADGPRYSRALVESQTCWRCRVLAVFARLAYALSGSRRGFSHIELIVTIAGTLVLCGGASLLLAYCIDGTPRCGGSCECRAADAGTL